MSTVAVDICEIERSQRHILAAMDNIQQIADAVQKGLQLVVRASVQHGCATSYIVIRFTLC